MKKQIFYYSRLKLGYYLLFNIGLMVLALLFTWTIFPNYRPVFYFAISACALSILSALIVFFARFAVVSITDEALKIDHNQPLKWSQIQKIEKITTGEWYYAKDFLKITPINIKGYKMTFMQKLSEKSPFGAFSVPLYAMNKKDAKKVEKLIKMHLSQKPSIN